MRAQTDLKNHPEVVEQMDVERPKENCLEVEEQMNVKRLKEKEQEFHLKQRYWN